MKKPTFNIIWQRIISNEGNIFHTKTDLEFTYEIHGKCFYPSRTEYAISMSDFEKAYDLGPIEGPGEINNLVRGPAYVWAVIHDSRISSGAW